MKRSEVLPYEGEEVIIYLNDGKKVKGYIRDVWSKSIRLWIKNDDEENKKIIFKEFGTQILI